MPIRIALSDAEAWWWSGVLTVTASNALAHLIEHLAIVGEPLGLGEGLPAGIIEDAFVDVANGYHVAILAGVGGIAGPFPAQTNAGDRDAGVG